MFRCKRCGALYPNEKPKACAKCKSTKIVDVTEKKTSAVDAAIFEAKTQKTDKSKAKAEKQEESCTVQPDRDVNESGKQLSIFDIAQDSVTQEEKSSTEEIPKQEEESVEDDNVFNDDYVHDPSKGYTRVIPVTETVNKFTELPEKGPAPFNPLDPYNEYVGIPEGPESYREEEEDPGNVYPDESDFTEEELEQITMTMKMADESDFADPEAAGVNFVTDYPKAKEPETQAVFNEESTVQEIDGRLFADKPEPENDTLLFGNEIKHETESDALLFGDEQITENKEDALLFSDEPETRTEEDELLFGNSPEVKTEDDILFPGNEPVAEKEEDTLLFANEPMMEADSEQMLFADEPEPVTAESFTEPMEEPEMYFGEPSEEFLFSTEPTEEMFFPSEPEAKIEEPAEPKPEPVKETVIISSKEKKEEKPKREQSNIEMHGATEEKKNNDAPKKDSVTEEKKPEAPKAPKPKKTGGYTAKVVGKAEDKTKNATAQPERHPDMRLKETGIQASTEDKKAKTETEKKPIPRFEPKNETKTDVKADAKTEPKPQPKEQAVQEPPKREESADAKTEATAEEKPKRDIKVIRSIYDRQRDGAASVKLVDSGKTEVKVVKLVNKDGITLEDKLRKENEEKELENGGETKKDAVSKYEQMKKGTGSRTVQLEDDEKDEPEKLPDNDVAEAESEEDEEEKESLLDNLKERAKKFLSSPVADKKETVKCDKDFNEDGYYDDVESDLPPEISKLTFKDIFPWILWGVISIATVIYFISLVT